jgi:hypothetical protein
MKRIREFDVSNITDDWMPLVKKYPEIFLEPSPAVLNIFAEGVIKLWEGIPDKAEELCNLRYGFECGIGWFNIIDNFCESIQNLLDKTRANGHEVFYKTFILKEKFGECRNQGDFYGKDYQLYMDEYDTILEKLVEDSLATCERTGKAGKCISRKGWSKVLCEEEAEKFLNYDQ